MKTDTNIHDHAECTQVQQVLSFGFPTVIEHQEYLRQEREGRNKVDEEVEGPEVLRLHHQVVAELDEEEEEANRHCNVETLEKERHK